MAYSVLEDRDGEGTAIDPDPIIVGREGLLGSLVNAISEKDRRGTYLISGYRGAGKPRWSSRRRRMLSRSSARSAFICFLSS